MHLAVDGIIFEQQRSGGISRLFATILPLMCDLDPNLEVTLYLAAQPRRSLPTHPHIQTQPVLPLSRMLRPRRYLWRAIPTARRIALMLSIDPSRSDLWHSTYYTRPLGRKCPHVVTVYDLIHEKFSDLFHPNNLRVEVTAKKRALAAADKIICISESTASDLQAIYGVERNKIQVIHLAPSLMFQPSDDSPPAPEHPYLLYVGARTLYKNFDTLLAAFERWQPQVPVDLVVVGGPWEESEIGRLSGHKRRHQIHLLTHVDDERLASLYRQALAFVYPSLYEGFGIPLLEAMACRCPIVASRIPSNEEIAGDYPVYFDPTSIDDLVSALDASAAIGRHPELEARGSIILARYSWEKTAAQTLVQYYRVTDKPIPSNLRQTLDTLGARRTETVKSGASNHA